ncbi:VOC family protein [Pseudovibrio sp. SPO723]|uniref:bleomycin resistance protein n=1 Tax=Nesiotobacter zosterae TaxID=392721 RepID=UPI0029C2DBC5|nr:VOC family protein [Pseudovibrio sp. SPO723]MDX5592690.1 VOC family protein [Pseudovibrio sp. SPO723]
MNQTADQEIEVLPNLPSLNLSETKTFYQGMLGFDRVIYEDQNTLILRRKTWEIHFWLCRNKEICNNSSLYVRGQGIDNLYQEFTKAGLSKDGASEPRLSSFELRPWNMKEFYIHDPHGNLLKFGRAPNEAETIPDARP